MRWADQAIVVVTSLVPHSGGRVTGSGRCISSAALKWAGHGKLLVPLVTRGLPKAGG